MDSESRVVDCIIVGAGVSGLAAASELARKGYRVVVLEARDRIGGRTYTSLDEGLPCPMDFGASFVHGVDGNPLAEYCQKHSIRLHKNSMDSLFFKPDGKLMEEATSSRLAATVFTALFYHSREASRNLLPDRTKSLADYLLDPNSPLFNGLQSDEERRYAAQAVTGMDGWTGAPLDEVSFRYWGFEREFEGVDKVVADGYQNVLSPMHDEILQNQGSIHLGDPVANITFEEDTQLLTIMTAAKKLYSAKSCICTIPLGVLKHGGPTFTPSLPPRRQLAINKTGFGLLNKIVLVYPYAWWPQDAAIAHLLQSQSGEGHPRIPASITRRALFGQSYLPITGKPALVFFIGGKDGRLLEEARDEDIKEWIHGVTSRALLNLPGAPSSAPEPTHIHVTRWNSDPFSRGSYAYISVSDAEDKEPASPLHFIELSRPLWDGRLGFAGEHTESDHYASVHGAMISGWREARRVVANLQGPWADIGQEN